MSLLWSEFSAFSEFSCTTCWQSTNAASCPRLILDSIHTTANHTLCRSSSGLHSFIYDAVLSWHAWAGSSLCVMLLGASVWELCWWYTYFSVTFSCRFVRLGELHVAKTGFCIQWDLVQTFLEKFNALGLLRTEICLDGKRENMLFCNCVLKLMFTLLEYYLT